MDDGCGFMRFITDVLQEFIPLGVSANNKWMGFKALSTRAFRTLPRHGRIFSEVL